MTNDSSETYIYTFNNNSFYDPNVQKKFWPVLRRLTFKQGKCVDLSMC